MPNLKIITIGKPTLSDEQAKLLARALLEGLQKSMNDTERSEDQ